MSDDVRWTLRAIQEAEDWIEWLHDRNSAAAAVASLELVRRTDRLAQFNELGRIGKIAGTRELSLPKWEKVVVYAIVDSGIQILTLRETRQNEAT
jgi:toxin ParE1/3/4